LLETRTAFEPGNAPLLDQLGHALYRGANLAGAEPPLRAARKLKFTSARNSEELARISLGRKDDAAALPYLVESLNQDPKQQPLWFERADAAERLKDRPQAASALESGVALGGTFRERRLHLVDLYLAAKQKGDALRHVDRLAQDDRGRRQTRARTHARKSSAAGRQELPGSPHRVRGGHRGSAAIRPAASGQIRGSRRSVTALRSAGNLADGRPKNRRRGRAPSRRGARWFREKLGAEANVWYPQTAALSDHLPVLAAFANVP